MNFQSGRKGISRLPWKRGPRAWEIAQRADVVLDTLNAGRRGFYSLRRTAKLLGISTQPVRDWIRLGQLRRDGPRRQISRNELKQFVYKLVHRAESFDPENYLDRFPLTFPFKKLGDARFVWPKGRKALNPRALAILAGCHPSLILKAIHCGRLRGRRRSPCRWEVSKSAWRNVFYLTLLTHKKKSEDF
jgi:hypothetical protein